MNEAINMGKCSDCKFDGGQECRRHAPYSSKNGRPQFPSIIDTWCCWCGDFEAVKEEKEEETVAYVSPKERCKLLNEINVVFNKIIDDLKNVKEPPKKEECKHHCVSQRGCGDYYCIKCDKYIGNLRDDRAIRKSYEKWKDGGKYGFWGSPTYIEDTWNAIRKYCEK